MANKKLILLALVAMGISCGSTNAQEQLVVPPFEVLDDAAPQLAIPEDSGSLPVDPAENLPLPNESSVDEVLEPFAEPIDSGDLQNSAQGLAPGEQLHPFSFEPAILESTGTWLRRGFWYTEFDVVIFDRIWQRDPMELMSQRVGTSTNQFGQTVLTFNALTLNGGQNGAEAAPRLKLGRFLFRDNDNRDHAIEFVIYGGGEWTQSGRLDVSPNNSAGTTFLSVSDVAGRGNAAFDTATSSQFRYDSRLNSFELNYHVSSRMKKDHMELEPSGHWVRRAQPSVTHSLVAGIRYLDMNESILWEAFGIQDRNNDGNLETGYYDVQTDNDMIGTQLGLSVAHERARWSLNANVRTGIFLNHANVDSVFDVTDDVTNGDNHIVQDNMTFLTDASLVAKWHLRPNLSIRAGLEGMFLTSLAMAPLQLNFAPVSTSENIARGDVAYLGGSIGLETYW
ncbi:MAG: BBP7 family outer membrane beta-barrel protein [Planctomycetales bacterium]|nr:BBP7 family outer membrane beta-barrel protein [Planctomycetales bacterium]